MQDNWKAWNSVRGQWVPRTELWPSAKLLTSNLEKPVTQPLKAKDCPKCQDYWIINCKQNDLVDISARKQCIFKAICMLPTFSCHQSCLGRGIVCMANIRGLRQSRITSKSRVKHSHSHFAGFHVMLDLLPRLKLTFPNLKVVTLTAGWWPKKAAFFCLLYTCSPTSFRLSSLLWRMTALKQASPDRPSVRYSMN